MFKLVVHHDDQSAPTTDRFAIGVFDISRESGPTFFRAWIGLGQ